MTLRERREQQRDISDEQRQPDERQDQMDTRRPGCQRPDGDADEHNVRGEIAGFRQATRQNEIFGERGAKSEQKRREEPAGFTGNSRP